jgi:hypothetical protein
LETAATNHVLPGLERGDKLATGSAQILRRRLWQNYIDRASLSVALPLISADFNMTSALKGLMLSAFFGGSMNFCGNMVGVIVPILIGLIVQFTGRTLRGEKIATESGSSVTLGAGPSNNPGQLFFSGEQTGCWS